MGWSDGSECPQCLLCVLPGGRATPAAGRRQRHRPRRLRRWRQAGAVADSVLHVEGGAGRHGAGTGQGTGQGRDSRQRRRARYPGWGTVANAAATAPVRVHPTLRSEAAGPASWKRRPTSLPGWRRHNTYVTAHKRSCWTKRAYEMARGGASAAVLRGALWLPCPARTRRRRAVVLSRRGVADRYRAAGRLADLGGDRRDVAGRGRAVVVARRGGPAASSTRPRC